MFFSKKVIASGLMEISTKFLQLTPLQTTKSTAIFKCLPICAFICMQRLDCCSQRVFWIQFPFIKTYLVKMQVFQETYYCSRINVKFYTDVSHTQ